MKLESKPPTGRLWQLYILFIFIFVGDRRLFQEFTASIYSFILNLWNVFTESFLRDIMQNASAEVITGNLEKALLTLRILRKLTVFGFYKPHLNPDCMGFLKVIFDRAKTTLECRKLPEFVDFTQLKQIF